MKRIIDYYLLQWKHDRLRQPLLLRGARQIGKTYAARQLGKTYESFVEINLEDKQEAHRAFSGNLDPVEMLIILSSAAKQDIIPGKTLLFLDEIQVVPRAIIALRYFYENMPELHVIAAGSLLDFAIQQVGIPVGRVQSLYMQPVSFIEFLSVSNKFVVRDFFRHNPMKAVDEPAHTICLKLLARYLAIGGMPKSIQFWIDNQKPLEIAKVHASILDSYSQDFGKYAKNHEIKYVEKVFDQIPKQLGQKFKYSLVEGEYRKRELSPALDLLVTSGVAKKVYYSAGQGTPLGAQSSDLDYKVIFLDIGLAQTSLGFDVSDWFVKPEQEFVNKGSLVEAFIGQELATYAAPYMKSNLYYWHKDSAPQQAEIDYLTVINYNVIPIEVKSGSGRTLKSLNLFLKNHKQSPYGIKFSTLDYSVTIDKDDGSVIYSYPLYAVAKVMSDHNPDMLAAIQALID